MRKFFMIIENKGGKHLSSDFDVDLKLKTDLSDSTPEVNVNISDGWLAMDRDAAMVLKDMLEKFVRPSLEKNGMDFRHAFFQMLNGKKIKLHDWSGYWAWENGTIMMHCKDGSVLDIRDTKNVAYTFINIIDKRWEVIED